MPYGVPIVVSSENHPKHKYNSWKKCGDFSVKLVVHNLLTTKLARVNIHKSKVVCTFTLISTQF